jgi:hypothetical protein
MSTGRSRKSITHNRPGAGESAIELLDQTTLVWSVMAYLHLQGADDITGSRRRVVKEPDK